MKHDQYIEARAMGITLMDAGHFATENVVCAPLAEKLARAFPDIRVELAQQNREPYGAV